MEPCPAVTSPSTGHVSCGKIISASPGWIASTGTSSVASPTTLLGTRCAVRGIRCASASSTDEAFFVAYCSNTVPPASISTMIVPAKYSPRITEVTIETKARMSASNRPPKTRRKTAQTCGPPPKTSAPNNGQLSRPSTMPSPNRSATYNAIPTNANPALAMSLTKLVTTSLC